MSSKKPKQGYKLVKWLFGKEIEILEEWEIKKFGTVIKLEYGNNLTETKRDGKGKPVYGSGGIIGFHLTPIVTGPGIIIARKGSLGNIFYESKNFFPIDTVYYVTKKETSIELKFLFYLISNLHLENYAIVTAQPGINREEVYTILIKLPPLPEQQNIASILSNVDALIESTYKIIEKTERLKKGLMQKLLTKGISHTKFKKVSWLFGKEIEIPEEWEIKSTSEILKITMGQSPSSKSYNEACEGLPFYQGVTDFGATYPNPTVWCTEPKKIAKENSILFSVRAPVGEINLTKTKCCLGRGVAALNPLENNLWYCYYLLNKNKKNFLIYSSGTTYDAINRNEIDNVKLSCTTNTHEQQKIASILSGVDAYIQKTQEYKEKLERLKKSLMQKLLTGQIRVKV